MTKIKDGSQRDLSILKSLLENPGLSQAEIARKTGMAVGTVNWHVRQLSAENCLLVEPCGRRKQKYIITEKGKSYYARLLDEAIKFSFTNFRHVRDQMFQFLENMKEKPVKALRIIGEGDVAEVCRLICLARGVAVAEQEEQIYAAVRIRGIDLALEYEKPKA